jgi:hypothetical protein
MRASLGRGFAWSLTLVLSLVPLISACTAVDSIEYGPAVYPDKAHIAREALPGDHSEIQLEGFGTYWRDLGFEHFRQAGFYLTDGATMPEGEAVYIAITMDKIHFLRWTKSQNDYLGFYTLTLSSVSDCYLDTWGVSRAIVLTQQDGRPVSFSFGRQINEKMSAAYKVLQELQVCTR